MRDKYPMVVERGRVLAGPMSTAPFDSSGAFHIPHGPFVLTVIAGSASTWEREKMAPPAWEHVSVSVDHPRCPTWEEMCFVKQAFFDDQECVVQFHPPKSQYINCHRYVLHLWRCPSAPHALPPSECV